MVNTFKLRKFGAFALTAFMPTIMFFIALLQFGLLYAYVFFAVGGVLAVFIGVKIISHPIFGMLEGSGLGVLSFDSTGLIRMFLVKVNPPYINGNIFKRRFTRVFDRETVSYLTSPEKAELVPDKDEIIIRLPKKEYSEKQFSMMGSFPVLVYNSVLGELYTKEMLAKLETETFVQHLVLYLNRKVEGLSDSVRDFARYVVEQTKPKGSILQSKIFWIVIIVVIGLLALAFFPQVMKTLGSAQLPALPSQPVTPRAGA